MWQIYQRNPRAFLWALLLHLALGIVLFGGIDWTLRNRQLGATENLITASLTLSPELRNRVAELRDPEAFHAAQEAQQRRVEEQRLAEQEAARRAAAAADAERQRLAEEDARRQAAALEARRQAEREARLNAEREARQRAQAEARRRAQLEAERQAEELARREAAAQAKRAAEEQARREAEEQARREAQERARQEAEEQARLAAEEQARREAEEQARQAAAEAARREQQELARQAAEAARVQRLASEWVPRIQSRVAQFWIRPKGLTVKASTLVTLKLNTGGAVAPNSVKVLESSGYPAFDAAVIRAIKQASPLPVPQGQDFELFEEFNFRFSP